MITRPTVPSRLGKPSDTQRGPKSSALSVSARLLLLLAFAFTVMADPNFVGCLRH